MAAATSTFIFFTSRLTFPPRPWPQAGWQPCGSAAGNYVEGVLDARRLATGTHLSPRYRNLTAQGICNVLVVTPGKTIQDKTIANFTLDSPDSQSPPGLHRTGIAPALLPAWVI